MKPLSSQHKLSASVSHTHSPSKIRHGFNLLSRITSFTFNHLADAFIHSLTDIYPNVYVFGENPADMGRTTKATPRDLNQEPSYGEVQVLTTALLFGSLGWMTLLRNMNSSVRGWGSSHSVSDQSQTAIQESHQRVESLWLRWVRCVCVLKHPLAASKHAN